jgi:hypothetical protein
MISSVLTILQQRYGIFLPFMQCTTMTFTLFDFQNLSTVINVRVVHTKFDIYVFHGIVYISAVYPRPLYQIGIGVTECMS